ncbi:MAG TPA: YbbC/YhhH family protein [Chitinophagaceae bacterium]
MNLYRQILLFLFVCCMLISCSSKTNNIPSLDETHARQFVERIKIEHQLPAIIEMSITRKKAIDIAEPVLFKTYGKKSIKQQRPYKTYLADGYWHISGTLPGKFSLGGVFEIVINGENGQIVKMTHGK